MENIDLLIKLAECAQQRRTFFAYPRHMNGLEHLRRLKYIDFMTSGARVLDLKITEKGLAVIAVYQLENM
jgi:hypothetical protein